MQNWRAAAALVVSVPLTLPGLINSINPKINVGVGTRLFDIAYLLEVSVHPLFPRPERLVDPARALQLTLASVVYYTLSSLFPAKDTILDHAILEHDGLSDDRSYSGSSEKKDDTKVAESEVA